MILDTQRKCILVRSGLELWVETERANNLIGQLKKPDAPRFITIDGQTINTFEILGVFTPTAMEERQRRKNGQWTCLKGKWHDKGQQCHCREYKEDVVAYVEGVGEVKFKR